MSPSLRLTDIRRSYFEVPLWGTKWANKAQMFFFGVKKGQLILRRHENELIRSFKIRSPPWHTNMVSPKSPWTASGSSRYASNAYQVMVLWLVAFKWYPKHVPTYVACKLKFFITTALQNLIGIYLNTYPHPPKSEVLYAQPLCTNLLFLQ